MAAILYTKGPVCTHNAVTHSGPMFVRIKSIVKQYRAACNKLQEAGFGEYHNNVFVKRFPSEVKAALIANPDLLTADEYTNKFYLTPPSCITTAMCEKLIIRGHATMEHFHWWLTSSDK